ncbi:RETINOBLASTOMA-RELATED 1 family protein [Dorcoceras hygrometricum]|uniref:RETINOBLASTOMA-RELATED 1 family protein n=1 Tax=Dorcoceras hygrometricum TaxID=472368 RepID=A0A2Z7CN88_9LAMI|nr:RETINOBLASTOMA-RELATED 1 family protein [Dorcoceras hygrometricum]
MFRGNAKTLSCRQLLRWENIRHRGNKGSDLLSVMTFTNELFLMMTAIHFGVKVNWSKILFGILKEMVDKTLKKAKGFAAQICVLLKSDPAITMSEAVPFPSLKILSIKTFNTYVVMNENIDARGKSDEPGMAKVAVVKRKSQSNKKSESSENATGEAPVEVVSEKVVSKKRPTVVSDEATISKKKRTTKSKASSSKASMNLVYVAQDAVPLQIFKPTPVAIAEQPPAPKRKAPKRKLRLTASSDDEFIEKESDVETVVVVQLAPTSADDVDSIIEVVTETARMDTDDKLGTATFETSFEETEMSTVLQDPEVTQSDNILVEVNESPAASTAKEIALATVTDVEQLSSNE